MEKLGLDLLSETATKTEQQRCIARCLVGWFTLISLECDLRYTMSKNKTIRPIIRRAQPSMKFDLNGYLATRRVEKNLGAL